MLQHSHDHQDFTEQVYLTVTGLIVQELRVPGVKNLYAPGEKCGQLYSQVRDAYERICSRLGADATCEEDSDLDDILNLMDEICQLVGYEMFRCGALFQQQAEEP